MMQRHVTDRPRLQSRSRTIHYLKIARGNDSRPDRGEAFRTAHNAGTGARLRAFMKIERAQRN